MELQNIGYEALHRPKRERAQLVQCLLLSFEAPSEDNFRVFLQYFRYQLFDEKSLMFFRF